MKSPSNESVKACDVIVIGIVQQGDEHKKYGKRWARWFCLVEVLYKKAGYFLITRNSLLF
jgi:hypothetical protein